MGVYKATLEEMGRGEEMKLKLRLEVSEWRSSKTNGQVVFQSHWNWKQTVPKIKKKKNKDQEAGGQNDQTTATEAREEKLRRSQHPWYVFQCSMVMYCTIAQCNLVWQ